MSAEIFEELSSSLINLDDEKYMNVLSQIQTPLACILTPEQNNSDSYLVFHELSLSIVKETHLIGLFLQICKMLENTPNSTQELLNQRNNDGKTPLHLAIMTGRKKLVKLYLENKADPLILDNQDQGVIHMATIAGQLSLLTLFHKVYKLDINPKDINGRTPLHLASLEGQEQSSTLLIAWSTDMNEIDNEGLAPLHLAAVAKSYRIVRHLLMRGANRNTKNKAGATPLKLAQQIGASEQIREALAQPYCLASMNPIKPPLQPVSNSYLSFTIYIITYFLRYILIFLFLIPNLSPIYGIIFILLCVFNFILFQIVSNKDPGYEKKQQNIVLMDLYEKYSGDFVCAYCEVRRPNHIKHCQHCNKCVRKFDHHCPWIHNCVGEKNHKLFFLFLLSTEIDFLFSCVIGMLVYNKTIEGEGLFRELFLEEPLKSLWAYVGLGISIFSAFAFLLVLPLFYVQLVNIIKKTTTSERFGYVIPI